MSPISAAIVKPVTQPIPGAVINSSRAAMHLSCAESSLGTNGVCPQSAGC